MERECPGCGNTYMQWSTLQTLCSDCRFRRTPKTSSKPRKPLPRATKPIRQRGKQHNKWVTFRDKVAKPYLDKKYGHVCAVLGCSESEYLDVDHIKGRGAHAALRYVVTNMRYLCRRHHTERTNEAGWAARTEMKWPELAG